MAWTWWGRRKSLTPEEKTAVAGVAANARFEVIPLKNARQNSEALPPGSCVTVTASPAHTLEATLDLGEWLRQKGHDVIPHLSARMTRDRAHLADLMARAKAAGMRKVFVVGGDGKPVGEIADGLMLLRAMHELGHPFEEVGVPAYPEGHSDIPDDVLMRVLKEKQQYAHLMATQMSFNADAVTAWIGRVRREGITLPVLLGVPGAVELTKLIRIGTRIGIADAARYVRKQRGFVAQMLRSPSFTPDTFLTALAPTLTDPVANVQALHVFTFNDVAATVAWQQELLGRMRNGG